MSNFLRLLCCVLFTFTSVVYSVFAQDTPISGTTGAHSKRSVINVRQLAAAAVSNFTINHPIKIPLEVEIPKSLPVPSFAGVAGDAVAPSRVASELMTSPSPPPASGFLALGDNNTSIPPDVQGAVGPNHLMTALNTQVRIQDKAGTVISTISLDGFWASLGNPTVFDPRLFFDPYANRWVFIATANPALPSSAILIGVSTGTDPSSTWNLFSIDADAGNTKWADYPSVGFNKDWIVVQVNMYSMGGVFGNSKVYVFKKADLYADIAATHTVISLDMSYGGVQSPALTYDNSSNTVYMIQTWNGNSAGSGYLRLYSVSGAVGAETVTPGAFVVTANPWQEEPSGSTNFAPQLGTANKISTNDSRIQNVVYRNGALWTAQTVFLPASGATTRSAVQWWQITTAGAITQRGRIDDATNTNFYAYPSICVNSNDEAVVGYSRFSSSTYASAYYSYRASSDAANTMRDDALLKAGETPYYKTFGGDENRWGDYSRTSVDPVNDIDLWTIQQYASTPSNKWGTWWGKIASKTVAFAGGMAPDYRNDNASSGAINLGFTFTFYGTDYTQVYINNNGSISFGGAVASFTPVNFPAVSGTPMIAPFWADVDTRETGSGLVYYVTGEHSFTVIWNSVGYNNQHSDKKNTFSVTITDGTDASIGIGNNVQFSYGDMQWTTGDASGGSGGFGGTAAEVGMNKGDGSLSVVVGRFDESADINFLDNKKFTYNVSSASAVASWENKYDYALKKNEDVGFTIPTVAKKMAHNLTVDMAGNSYITGYSDGGTPTKFDAVTIKYDPFGNKHWISRYNHSANKDDKAYAVAVDASGNVYITGESDGGATKQDAFIVKYDPLGTQQWSARYNNSSVNKKDAGYAIALSPAGDIVYVAGESDGGTSKADFLIAAYSASTGAELWVSKYNGSGNKPDKAYALAVDASGNVIVTGESDGGTAKADYATVKYTGGAGGGSVMAGWPQRYNMANKKDYAFALSVDAGENVYVTGGSESTTASDYATIKYNSAGTEQWVARYNNTAANKNDVAYALAVDGTGNVYVTGASEGSISKYDFATAKYNSAGSLEWVKRYNGGKVDIARSIALCTAEGALFITGGSEQSSSHKYDFVTQRLASSDGTLEWSGSYNGSSSKVDVAYAIASSGANCALIVTGTSEGNGTTKLDLATLHGASGTSLPFASVREQSPSLLEEQLPSETALRENYPNPFNPSTVIRFILSEQSAVNLKVFNLLGQEIATIIDDEELEEGEHEAIFDASAQTRMLSSGVYFYRLQTIGIAGGRTTEAKKMILVR